MYFEIHSDRLEERANAPEARRLLRAWHALVERFDHAPYEAFEPDGLGPIAGHLMVMRPEAGEDYLYTYYGTDVLATTGFDMTGRSTSQFTGEVGAFVREFYNAAMTGGQPLIAVNHSALAAHAYVWERLALPCRTREGEPRLVVFARPREFRHDLFAAAFEASSEGMLALRLIRDAAGQAVDGMIVAANRKAATIMACSLDEMTNGRFATLFPELVARGALERYAQVAQTREALHFEAHYDTRFTNGWFAIAITPLGDGVLVAFHDISARKQAEEEAEMRTLEYVAAYEALNAEVARRVELEQALTRLATVDDLTGLANRRALTSALDNLLVVAGVTGDPVALVALDLDHFKMINDTFGHATGDRVLKAAGAAILTAIDPDTDVAGRMGGEEFLIALPGRTLTEATTLAETIRQGIAAAGVRDGTRAITVTASLGVAVFNGAETMDLLMSRVDAALYGAKRGGRNRVEVSQTDAPPLVPLELPGARLTTPKRRRAKTAPRTPG